MTWFLLIPLALLVTAVVWSEINAEREYRRFRDEVERLHERWDAR